MDVDCIEVFFEYVWVGNGVIDIEVVLICFVFDECVWVEVFV